MKKISFCLISFFYLFIISFILMLLGVNFLIKEMVIFIEWELISLNSLRLTIVFLFDWISLLFISFVLLISSFVIFYRKEYIAEDFNINRFVMLVLIFVLSIIFLIISPNLIRILLGWDGLGLVSYCLVIYFQNEKSYRAGILTALSNRIGDVAFLLAIAWILNYGSWHYIFYLEVNKLSLESSVIGGLIILAAITKRAQIPFSSWLPAAIAAPTPVSALVHSSTLVTAGVYLLIRFNLLLLDSVLFKGLLLIGGLTIFMAGLGANYEFDLKKIIALSTLSQLGLIIRILAIGFAKLAFFHLLTHALFKALLFMCAGSIIHNIKNFQDIRFIGGLSLSIPLTISCFNVANLALRGFPFLAGFYSKDLILEVMSLSNINILIYFLFFFSTGLTVCYSFRLVFYTVTGEYGGASLHLLSDEGWGIIKSILGLIFMAIIGGSLLSWLIFPVPYIICLPFFIKILVLITCIMGGLLGYTVSNVGLFFKNFSLFYYHTRGFLGSMWIMPYISTIGVIKPPLYFGFIVVKNIDQGWREYFGGQILFNYLIKISSLFQFFQINNLKLFLMTFIFWIILLIILQLV